MKQADSKAKTKRVVLVPKPHQEAACVAFKEWCTKNGLQVSDQLYELVLGHLAAHHWRKPGDIAHSQASITEYSKPGAGQQLHGLCGFKGCRAPAVGQGVFVQTGKAYKLCGDHFQIAEGQRQAWRDLKRFNLH